MEELCSKNHGFFSEEARRSKRLQLGSQQDLSAEIPKRGDIRIFSKKLLRQHERLLCELVRHALESNGMNDDSLRLKCIYDSVIR